MATERILPTLDEPFVECPRRLAWTSNPPNTGRVDIGDLARLAP
jgi:hypothetical protein